MTPYESDTVITTTVDDEIASLPVPGRCRITRLAVYRVDNPSGEVNVDTYSRQFISDDAAIAKLQPQSDGLLLTLTSRLPVKVGDPVVITDTADYDTSLSADPGTLRVLQVLEGGYVVLVNDQTDHGEAFTGSIRLQIEDPEQNLYRVMPRITGVGFAETWTAVTFVNQDPLGNLNIGVNRRIYVQPKKAGTYRVLVRCEESVAMGN